MENFAELASKEKDISGGAALHGMRDTEEFNGSGSTPG